MKRHFEDYRDFVGAADLLSRRSIRGKPPLLYVSACAEFDEFSLQTGPTVASFVTGNRKTL